MPKIFITGEQGNLAYHLAKRFERTVDHRIVWGYNRQIPSFCTRETQFGKELDIRNIDLLRKAMFKMKPNVVVHIAALVNTDRCSKDPLYAYEVNAMGSYNVAKVASELQDEYGCIRQYVYYSTTATYQPCEYWMNELHTRDPQTLYGQTKYMGELITRTLFPESLVILPCFVFGGPRDYAVSNIARLARNAYAGNPDDLTITLNPDKRKDYMYVTDFTEAVFKLIDSGATGQYNVSGMNPVMFGDILCRLGSYLDLRYHLSPVDDYMGNHLVDSSKVRKAIHWEPKMTIDEGLEKLIKEDIPGGTK